MLGVRSDLHMHWQLAAFRDVPEALWLLRVIVFATQ